MIWIGCGRRRGAISEIPGLAADHVVGEGKIGEGDGRAIAKFMFGDAKKRRSAQYEDRVGAGYIDDTTGGIQ